MAVNSSKQQNVPIGNWTTLKEVPVYDGFRHIVRRTYRLPDQQVADFDIKVEGRVVCVLALTADQQVVLCRQFRPGPDAIVVELPGGGVERGEDPATAAARELLEETGYSGELQYVAPSLVDAYSSALRHNFVATNCSKQTEIANDQHEFTQTELMSLPDFRQHLRSGQLTDITTGYLGLDFLNLL